MARSMTGFGQAQRRVAQAQYWVEIRSLNSRYFKATIRLPELWSSLENEIERLLRERLRRGTVYFVLRMKTDAAAAAYTVNAAALDNYMGQLEAVSPQQSDIKLTLDMGSLLQLPGVCVPPEEEEIIRTAQGEVKATIQEAIEAVLAMRMREGAEVAADLLANCQAMETQLGIVRERAGSVVQEYYQRLKKRVEELLAASGAAVDDQNMAREVAVFAERCDVAEEISRLTGHIGQFRQVLAEDDAPGRKLDFIAQEMLREANTVASKANDVAIARAVVEIKTAVDRIKEQVQNVE
jgi:uncharacterized protein (TIGR00255 family)